MAQYLTQQDVQDYGSDLVDFAQRAAVHAVAPHLQNLEQQNHELQRRLAQEARHRLDAAVEQAIPNYRTIDQDPRWHQFLLTVDSLSGRQRQTLLNDAIASADANRVIAFFRTFLREAGGADHTASHASNTSSYGTRRATSSVNGPIYSAAQIAKLYDQKRRGAYAGREAEWARQEVDIFRAQHEGRVVGGKDVQGK
jgi:hypothetical protein